MISSPPGTEMFQFPGLPPHRLCIQRWVSRYQPGGVAPFGHPRITACWRLPGAFRSHPRPSSALGAKASTVRPCSLGIPIARSRPLPSRQDLARSSASINNGCRLSPLTHLHYSAVVQVRHLRLIACRRAHRPTGPRNRPQPVSRVVRRHDRGDKNAARPERFGSNRRGPSIPMDMLASFCLLLARAVFCVCISYNCPDRPVIPDFRLGSRRTRGAVAARLIGSL